MCAYGMMHFVGSIDGYVVTVGKCAYRFYMIHVIVGDEYCADVFEIVAVFLQTFANGAYTNAHINEDAIIAIANEIAIAAAAATEAEECILIG